MLLNHELTVSHGFAPVQHIDLVLFKENMNNMKRLSGAAGKRNWLLRKPAGEKTVPAHDDH